MRNLNSYIKYLILSYLPLLVAGCNNVGSHELILENGSYFNGTSFVPFKEIVIKDGQISNIRFVSSNNKARRISLKGKYIIPGLVDAHVHVYGCPANTTDIPTVPEMNINSSLRCGVTTVIDLFSPEDDFKRLRDSVRKHPENYASFITAGPIITAPNGHGTEYGVQARTINSVQEAQKVTNEVIDKGVDIIKIVYEAYSSKYTLTKEMVDKIVVTAHRRHKKVFAHIRMAAEAIDCVDAGVDVLVHIPIDTFTEDQLIKIRRAGTIITPTITVLQSFYEGHDASYMCDSLLWHTAYRSYLATFTHGSLSKIAATNYKYGYRINLKNCIRMNIPVMAGTDAGNYAVFFGYSLHNELLQYVNAGMSPSEALCTATQNFQLAFPAIKTGRIAIGYDADMVVLDKDPLEDIRNTKSYNASYT